MPGDEATLAAFDALYDRALRADGAGLAYDLCAPLWQFLCHVADTKPVLLRGSGNPDIAEFEPRQSGDVNAFGDHRAVYVASDGLWPLYFAILDRDRHPMSLINTSVRVALDGGRTSEP